MNATILLCTSSCTES